MAVLPSEWVSFFSTRDYSYILDWCLAESPPQERSKVSFGEGKAEVEERDDRRSSSVKRRPTAFPREVVLSESDAEDEDSDSGSSPETYTDVSLPSFLGCDV
jgi:hypothetical protein